MFKRCLNCLEGVSISKAHLGGQPEKEGSFQGKRREKRGSREELKEKRIPSALFSKEFKARRHHRARKKGLWSRESHQAPLLGIPPSFTLPATGNREIRDETDSVISFELNPRLWLEWTGGGWMGAGSETTFATVSWPFLAIDRPNASGVASQIA